MPIVKVKQPFYKAALSLAIQTTTYVDRVLLQLLCTPQSFCAQDISANALKIFQQTFALAYHLDQPATSHVVVLVGF